jgi:putative aldouronate transport system permease protein
MKFKRLAKSDLVFNVIVYGFGLLALFIVAYPIYFVLIASVSDPNAVMNGNVWFWPVRVTFDGYSRLLEDSRVWIGYRNTIAYTFVGTFLSLAFTIPAGYALSRRDLYGRKALSFFFTFTMFFGGGLIPTFLTVRDFGLYNTFWVLVVPFSVSVYN